MERDAASYLRERRDLSIPMANANLYSFAILPLVARLATVFVYLWGYGALSDGSIFERPVVGVVAVYVIGFLVIAFGIAAHEAIHGLSWAYFGGKPVGAIKFGFQVKTLTPYAHCKEPIEARLLHRGGDARAGRGASTLSRRDSNGERLDNALRPVLYLRRRRGPLDPVAHP